MTTNLGDNIAFGNLKTTLVVLRNSKQNDRSEKDSAYAVTITEMEKLLAYFYLFVMTDEEARKDVMGDE